MFLLRNIDYTTLASRETSWNKLSRQEHYADIKVIGVSTHGFIWSNHLRNHWW